MKEKKCLSCGAPLKSNKCEYCGTEYILDSENNVNLKGEINDYVCEMKIDGKDTRFYIANMETETIYGGVGRTIKGLSVESIAKKRKITLIEM